MVVNGYPSGSSDTKEPTHGQFCSSTSKLHSSTIRRIAEDSGLMIKICRYIKEHGWCSNIFSEVTRMRQLQLMLAEAKCAA